MAVPFAYTGTTPPVFNSLLCKSTGKSTVDLKGKAKTYTYTCRKFFAFYCFSFFFENAVKEHPAVLHWFLFTISL